MMNRAVIIFLITIFVVPFALASTQTETITNMDDSYTNSSAASANYDGSLLRVQGSNVETFFRFNLSDVSAPYVLGANLYAYVLSISASSGFDIKKTGTTDFTETNLTYNTKPSVGSALDTKTIASTGWNLWTITDSYITGFNSGDDYIGYGITGSENLSMEDKENTGASGNVPYLNLTTMTPEVSADSPSDSYSTYDTTIDFDYTTSDLGNTGNLVNCTLVFDGAVNKVNSSAPENSSGTFSLSGIFPGSHTWKIDCYDNNRAVYKFNSLTLDLDVLAKVEWYNPGSSTPLDIGTAIKGAVGPAGSREIYSNNTNENVMVTCSSGDCGVFGNNWSTTNMDGGSILDVMFNCTSTTAGVYEADFALTSDQDGSSDILTVNCSILAPDLQISTENITFDDDSPTENQVVEISAAVYNAGTSTATDAVVRFYEGNYLTGAPIGGDHIITLGPGASTIVLQNWTSKIGDYDIYVELDPEAELNGSIDESDESNNFAFSTMSISMWTTFVGNVTGWMQLASANNDTVLKWFVPDTTNSILYVTDTDSTPEFSSMVALSRTVGGTFVSGDFEEVDLELSTASYPDSVNSTFTTGGTPIETRTFDVFGDSIENVPVVETTNTSSFVTGILWDSDDDSGNNQYDSTDKEDLIFVTVVNKTKVGMYGTYDYEIKVPSRLKNYKGPNYQTVTFYTEIK